MTSQRVLFTPLPNGPVADVPGRFALSVHIAPRLTGAPGDTLAKFPEWKDWPKTVNAMGWSVIFGAGAPIPASVVSAPARSDLWNALFGQCTVRPHAQTYYDARKIRSYPARNVRDFLRDRYTKTALSSPTEFPHIDDLLADDAFGPLSTFELVRGNTGTTALKIENALNDPAVRAVVNGPPLADVAKDFYQLVRFHQPRLNADPDTVPAVPMPALDFHEAVSTAGQWPPLMRLLGLVVDLVVDVGSMPASPTEVQIVPSWTPSPQASPAVAPVRTRCTITSSEFRARPRAAAPELVDGRLPLNDTNQFAVLQEDQDGGGLKAVDFAQNLVRFKTKRSSATPDRYALPSLRSGGLSVARTNRAPAFHDKMAQGTTASKSAGNDQPGVVVLDAEDLTRGYRIDIRDERDATWFSLTARVGSYRFPTINTEVPFTDEGWVSAVPTEDSAKDIYLQETLFRWGGWSLAAPRPGARLATTQGGDPLTTAPNTPGTTFPVQIDPKVKPGTLPRLRFGRSYQVRARAVDLAGNSVPLDPGNRDPLASPPVLYGRFEPVPTPLVLPHAPRTEGESLERVVLRSNYNSAPPPGMVARHVVPPKADQLLAEQHGLFDKPYPNSTVDPATYGVISAYIDPSPPEDEGPVLQSEQGTFLSFKTESASDPDDHKKVRYYPVDHVTLPYLPDPMARGAMLRFLNRWSGFELRVPFSSGETWPDHKPVRLVVREGGEAEEPTYLAGERVIDVPLAKADVVRLRLSAYLDREDLDSLAIWKWMVDAGGGSLAGDVVAGRHWMVTPYRTLTLVHAVRQPLRTAEFVAFDVKGRKLGETSVTFFGRLSFSKKSTSRIDIHSAWDEYVDEGLDPMAPRPRRAPVFTVSGDRGVGPDFLPDLVLVGPDNPNDRQEFHDTKHRNVTYSTVATTRFGEYFVQRVYVTAQYNDSSAVDVLLPTAGKGVVPGTVTVKKKIDAELDGKVKDAKTYQEPVHFEVVDAVAGKVRLYKTGILEGTKLDIGFLVPPLVRPYGENDSMTPVTLNIKSTAPPAAPKVQYVVPTFGWERTSSPTGAYSSKRLGNGLRVYLDRPWWSTGEGELLGVLLPVPDAPAALEAAQPVTRWGVDPVFDSLLPPAPRPRLPHFPGRSKSGENLSVPGSVGFVDVAGHPVGFDAVRKLWYCDIEVFSLSYFPFIRLALARFQPDSVDGAHLSPAVIAEFAQLAPDRSASVVFDTVLAGGQGASAGVRTVNVTVTGFSYNRAGNLAGTTGIRVTLEERDPKVPNDLGWEAVGDPLTLSPQAVPGNETIWTGKGKVPKAKAGSPQRLVIQEFERHRTGAGTTLAERVVYTDIINI